MPDKQQPHTDLGAARAAAAIESDPLALAIRSLSTFDSATDRLQDEFGNIGVPPEWLLASASALANIAQAQQLRRIADALEGINEAGPDVHTEIKRIADELEWRRGQ